MSSKRNFIIRETLYAIAFVFLMWVIVTKIDVLWIQILSVFSVLFCMFIAYYKGRERGRAGD